MNILPLLGLGLVAQASGCVDETGDRSDGGQEAPGGSEQNAVDSALVRPEKQAPPEVSGPSEKRAEDDGHVDQSNEAKRARYEYPGRQFEWWDALALGVAQAAYLVVEFTQDGPEKAHWTGAVPVVDQPFRDWIVARTRPRRESADLASDYLWYGSIIYPFVASTVIPFARGSTLRAPIQMNLINAQAFVASSLVVRMPHKWIGRTRPNALGCAEDADYDEQCGRGSRLLSFPSGHTQIAMTGAGLSCAHHLHGKLFAETWADATACGAAVFAAGSVGYLRMRADRHWMSDTLIGAALGFGFGYGIPTLFYYHPFWEKKARRHREEQSLFFFPAVSSHGAVFSVAGFTP